MLVSLRALAFRSKRTLISDQKEELKKTTQKVKSMEVSHRLKSIPPYVFAEMDKKRLAAIASGVDVINLGIGDP
ncbi:MAG: hypothetical protein WCT03_22690, partial [Candidatus Obscuribacterales bacterium]